MITCRLITETVAEAYGVSVNEMHSPRLHVDIVRPRHMAWALARHLTRKPLSDIGRLMGGRDHTTVLAGVRNIMGAIESDPETRHSFEALAEAITILGQACAGSQRLSRQFPDIDPLAVADRLLSAQLGTSMPTFEEVRALAMGVRHYADEALLVSSDSVSLQRSPANRPERQSPPALVTRSARPTEFEAAALAVVTAHQELQAAAFTTSERGARQRREDTIIKLANLLERT